MRNEIYGHLNSGVILIFTKKDL